MNNSITLYVEGTPPEHLAHVYRDHTEPVVYFTLTGQCGRCGHDLSQHWWQLVDPDVDEQAGVIDCGLRA